MRMPISCSKSSPKSEDPTERHCQREARRISAVRMSFALLRLAEERLLLSRGEWRVVVISFRLELTDHL